MPRTPIQHPDRDKLVAFGLGKLDFDEAEKIADHLDSCHDCSETIISMQDDTFVSLVRNTPARENNPDQEPQVRSVSESAVDVTLDSSSEARRDATDSPELPAELRDHPRYEILELIGRGGMGDVYKAQHKVMNRAVALKVIKPELVRNEAAVARFQREVQAAARLHHAKIVTAHDAAQAGDLHYLVMEYVDGVNLDEVIRARSALPVGEACNYVRQAAEGLQHAYEHGMVHRDIKPHNLMLSPNGQVRILDFGLAGFATESALLDAGSPETGNSDTTPRHLTIMGSVMGTPDYIAPEQAHDAHSADIRADIYSLGCTLYSLLTGEPPHKSDSVAEKLKAHAEDEPAAIESVRVEVPQELADVVRRMMAKDPAARFQTPAEVADALAPFVDKHRTDGGSNDLPRKVTGAASSGNTLPITFALCFVGTLSILAFVLAMVMFSLPEAFAAAPPWILTWAQYGWTTSLIIGIIALIFADRSERNGSHRSAVFAGLLNLLPLNPATVLLSPLTIWTLLKLRDPASKKLYEQPITRNQEEEAGRWRLVITCTVCLLLCIYGGTFFFIQLGQTTLKFEVSDPSVAVRFFNSKITVENDNRTIHIKPGTEHTFTIEQDGVELETDALTLRRGDKIVLSIDVVDGSPTIGMRGANLPIRKVTGPDTGPQDHIKKLDLQSLQGVWTFVRGESNGQSATPRNLEVAANVWLLKDPQTGRTVERMTFEIDPRQQPKQIDVQHESTNKPLKGIYKLVDDELHVTTSSAPGGKRPQVFAKGGQGNFTLVMRRAPKPDQQRMLMEEALKVQQKKIDPSRRIAYAVWEVDGKANLRFANWLLIFEAIDVAPGLRGLGALRVPRERYDDSKRTGGGASFSMGESPLNVTINDRIANGVSTVSINEVDFRLEGNAEKLVFESESYTASSDVQTIVIQASGKTRLSGNSPAPEAISGSSQFQGTWRRVSVITNGEERTDEYVNELLRFEGETFFEPGNERPRRGRFVVNTSVTPKQIDLHIPTGQNSDLVLRGIYKFEEDRLTIFQQEDWTASKRPASFEPKRGDKRSLLVFERVQVSDRELLQGAWTATAVELGGQTAPKSAFDGKRMMFSGDLVSRFGKVNQIRELRLNPTTTPKQIDIGGSVEGQFSKAIYELNGDRLRLCLPQKTEHARPKSFDTEGTLHLHVTLQRAALTELDKLQGTWKAVALEAAGQDAPAPAYTEKYMVIRGERISRVGKLGEVEPFLEARDFRIDTTVNPKALDISKTDDGEFAEFSQSIYELNGDTLRVCFSQQSDAPRPTSFDTTDTRYFCFTLKREKSDE